MVSELISVLRASLSPLQTLIIVGRFELSNWVQAMPISATFHIEAML
jgi:hypothetical protein